MHDRQHDGIALRRSPREVPIHLCRDGVEQLAAVLLGHIVERVGRWRRGRPVGTSQLVGRDRGDRRARGLVRASRRARPSRPALPRGNTYSTSAPRLARNAPSRASAVWTSCFSMTSESNATSTCRPSFKAMYSQSASAVSPPSFLPRQAQTPSRRYRRNAEHRYRGVALPDAFGDDDRHRRIADVATHRRVHVDTHA